MRRLPVTACLALATLGALAPAAGAQNPFRPIIDDWRADGQVTPCKYSADQLNATLNLPGDFEQYAPGLVDQIQNALQAQAGGACDRKEPAPAQREEPAAPAPSQPPPSAPAPEPEPVVEVAEPPAPDAPLRDAIEAAAKAPAPPVAATPAAGGGDAPAPVWLLAVLAGIGALAGIAAFAAWLFGWSGERFTRPLAAAAAEAGGRGADLAAEFRDWLRLGR